MEKGEKTPLGSLYITMPGQHNALNATAATAIALELGVPFSTITTALASFHGIDRRFSFKGTYKGAELFDDYGHHPVEIKHTLAVAKKRTNGRLIVIFQPHRYSRTKGLWKDFMKVFSEKAIDHLFITDIHAASEKPLPGISGELFVKELQNTHPSMKVEYAKACNNFTAITDRLKSVVQENDLVLFLGAGKINKIADTIKI